MNELIKDVVANIDEKDVAACEAAAAIVRQQYSADDENPMLLHSMVMHTTVRDDD